MPDANRVGLAGEPGDGPFVQIWLKTNGDQIVRATYDTNGCPSSIGCSSALCELAIGREMKKMKLLEANELEKFLGGLPEGKGYYAELAIKALRHAMDDK
jgi:NifU-like protein involved in Fe-S cluster formation